MKHPLRLAVAALAASAASCAGPAAALADDPPAKPAPVRPWTMEGRKTIALHTRDGRTLPIGTVEFRPDGDRTAFRIDMDDGKFAVYFLSMRNFRCVEGPDVECWVPYPYGNPMSVTATNLDWLADNLLFLFKTRQEHGATMTNGIRYDLRLTRDGIVGKPQAIDLDAIASPPKDGSAAPYGPADRDDYPEGSRWVDELVIR